MYILLCLCGIQHEANTCGYEEMEHRETVGVEIRIRKE